MSYVLNPGDGYDVVILDQPQIAINALKAQRIVGRTLAHLYSYGAGVFREYVDGNWYVVEKSNLPMKVLAVDCGPKPFLLGPAAGGETR